MHLWKTGFSCVMIWVLVVFTAQAQKTVLLNGSKQIINLNPHVKYLRDDAQKLTISQVLQDSLQKNFIPNRKVSFNLGPGEAVVWIKVKLRATKPGRYLLELGDTGVEEIILYQQDKTQKQYIPTDTLGDNVPFRKRSLKATNYLFQLDIQDRKPHIVYLKCYAFEVLTFPLRIGSYEAFLEGNHQYDVIMGGFYGVVLIMIFYNLFIFISTRQPSYLYYILYVFSSTLTVGTLKGHSLEYLWPNRVFFNDFLPIYMVITGFFIVLFANRFLNTKKTAPRLRKFSLVFYGLFTLALVAAPFKVSLTIIILFFAVVSSSIFVIFMGVAVLRKNYRPARCIQSKSS